MLREETPIDWRISDSRRYPEIVLVPDLHHGVTESREDLARAKKGDHGWAPENREMHGIFLATGQRLPTGREIGDISAVDIYPLLLELLGIREPGRGGDGTDLAKLVAADE